MSFCSQCGKEKDEGAAFCPYCGANNAPREERKERLSMEDFLAMNSAYQEAKNNWEKKENAQTLAAVFIMLALIPGSIILAFALLSGFVLVAGIVIVAALIVFMVSKERKEKAKLEQYGAALYKEYLQTNGFSV